MKEMRAIVEYLEERKAYSEVRGRKMWMDYASSGVSYRFFLSHLRFVSSYPLLWLIFQIHISIFPKQLGIIYWII